MIKIKYFMENEKVNKKVRDVTPVKTNLIKDGFFGWNNFKWLITEARNIYSNKDSFFSKKRIESGVAFIIAQWGMIFFLLEKHNDLTMGEFLLWAAAEFAVSGYIINKIQSEKKAKTDTMSPDAGSGSDTPPIQ